jgi:hypothetical protein
MDRFFFQKCTKCANLFPSLSVLLRRRISSSRQWWFSLLLFSECIPSLAIVGASRQKDWAGQKITGKISEKASSITSRYIINSSSSFASCLQRHDRKLKNTQANKMPPQMNVF